MKILVAEDEPDMQKIICLYLERAGYIVSAASDGEEAFEKLCRQSYDLLIADWMMPKMSGLQLCKEIRFYAMPIKIILLTAKSEVENEIMGLTYGADDYIKKPFEPKVLLLRIQKMFGLEDILCCGQIRLNVKTKTAFLINEEIKLTQKEFMLLEIFIRNKGITLSRDLLLEKVWGNDYNGDERTLDTHIRRLRNKIGKAYIVTYIGTGYRMENPYE